MARADPLSGGGAWASQGPTPHRRLESKHIAIIASAVVLGLAILGAAFKQITFRLKHCREGNERIDLPLP